MLSAMDTSCKAKVEESSNNKHTIVSLHSYRLNESTVKNVLGKEKHAVAFACTCFSLI